MNCGHPDETTGDRTCEYDKDGFCIFCGNKKDQDIIIKKPLTPQELAEAIKDLKQKYPNNFPK